MKNILNVVNIIEKNNKKSEKIRKNVIYFKFQKFIYLKYTTSQERNSIEYKFTTKNPKNTCDTALEKLKFKLYIDFL